MKGVNTPICETMSALADLKRMGKIRYVGVSNFTQEQIEDCLLYTSITTGMPVKEIILYGAEAVEEASCNGLPVTCIKKDEYTHLLHL